MAARPEKTVQKLLISSTAHFEGEFVAQNFSLDHAWPRLHSPRAARWLAPGPHARTALVAVMTTLPSEEPEFIIPNYEHLGDLVCDLMSLLFGKRFDNHGPIEQSGFYGVPDLHAFETACDPALPQNAARPRVDFQIPLKLEEVGRLAPVLFSAPTEATSAFRLACKFYRQALVAAEDDVEIAYLHLITAGEILSGLVDLEAETLVDAATRATLARIEAEHPDGARTARVIRGRLTSIRRRFVAAFDALTTDDFFTRSETTRFGKLQRAGYLKALGAAYDLRSKYLHTGRGFGGWLAPRGADNEERMTGRPVVPDRSFANTLANAPTLVGLERIVRYGLLRRAEGFGVDLAPSPPPEG